MTVSLRPIRPDDHDFLLHLYGSTREEELAMVAWPPGQRDAFVRQQFEAQHAHYQQHYAGASFDLVLLAGEVIGRLYVARWAEEIRVVDIALLPEHRGSGVGGALLRQLLAEADAAGKRVSVHVEIYNPARRLYERLGFRQAGDLGVYLLLERRSEAVAAG